MDRLPSREQLDDKIKELKQKIQDSARTVDELQESKLYYQTLLDNAPVGIWHASPDGSGGYINSKLAEITGLTSESAEGAGWTSTLHPEDKERVFAEWTNFIEGKNDYNSTYRFKHPNGEDRWVVGQATPVLNEAGIRIGHIGTLTDITERKQAENTKERLERQIQQAQKLEALGTLAGGIAHDFNNLLLTIQGNISLILHETDTEDPHYESLTDIEGAVISGAKLTKQLLGYARKGKYDVKSINLNTIAEATSNAFGRVRKEITIDLELAPDLSSILADENQMEQVLLNIFVNAADSMPNKGKVTIKTVNSTHEDMKGELYEPRPGKYVKLQITDSGVGMDKNTQQRIFEPFYTTKEMGRGTGLGLAAVYGIIKSHGGYINVDSVVGAGTTFTIFLPATPKEFSKTIKTEDRSEKGNGVILIVDDEEMVLKIGIKMLKKLGYTVLEANCGKEAIEIFKEKCSEIDLLILDMIMPNMGGGEVFDKIKQIDTDAKVLLSSGYSVDGKANDILNRGCDGFIQKPFSIKELSLKIKELKI